jgi:hypothetical protein
MSRRGIWLGLVLCLCVPASAGAAQSARIHARFTPERLGAATTVSFGFQLTANEGLPAALSAVQLGYPLDLGLATSGLGLAPCSPIVLEGVGPEACPPDSRMGSGSATIEIRLATETIEEQVTLELFAGPSSDGYLHILVYVSGVTPVIAQTVLYGVLLPGRLSIAVPPIPGLPGSPDVVVARMQMTLGGHLTYYERVAGRIVAYHPAGVGLPSRCPAGGFRFAATFAFADGTEAGARTVVPCPQRRSRGHRAVKG